jgi:hypothetical protein
MSDIVERLRQQATVEAKKFGDARDIQIEWRAAAEIERLRARVEVLEKALRQIQTTPHPSVAAQCIGCYGHQRTATYALEDAAP